MSWQYRNFHWYSVLVGRNFSVKIKQVTKDVLMFVRGVKNYISFEQILNFMRSVKMFLSYNDNKTDNYLMAYKSLKMFSNVQLFYPLQHVKVKYLYHWLCYNIAVGYNNADAYELNCFVSMLPIIILFISGQRYSKHVFSEASHIISELCTIRELSYSLASMKWCTL